MQKQVIHLVPGDILHWDKEFNKTTPDTFDIVLNVKLRLKYCCVIVLYQDNNQYYVYAYDFQLDRLVEVL
jgi:hypothetical protein